MRNRDMDLQSHQPSVISHQRETAGAFTPPSRQRAALSRWCLMADGWWLRPDWLPSGANPTTYRPP